MYSLTTIPVKYSSILQKDKTKEILDAKFQALLEIVHLDEIT